MSSPRVTRRQVGASLVVAASLLALAWYAQAQLIYSLAFVYQVARAIFPGLSTITGAN